MVEVVTTVMRMVTALMAFIIIIQLMITTAVTI